MKDKPEKFLGFYITFYGKTHDTFQIIEKKLNDMLNNIDNSLVRNEYKTRVFIQYGLPSLRYLLTVHNLTDTQLDLLDSAQTRMLKKWLNIPSHGATPSILYGAKGLKISMISELYIECHTLSLASTLTKGDPKVKHAVLSKVSRESQWSNKSRKYGVKASMEMIELAGNPENGSQS